VIRKIAKSRLDIELPTVGLIAGNYLLWVIALLTGETMPITSAILMCLVLVLQSSIVHELIHGHPTNSNSLNLCLGILPITLWYPIHLFKETHLKHHKNTHITIPDIDPESYFCRAGCWQAKSNIGRLFALINMTLFGRLLFSVPNTLIEVFKRAVIDLSEGTKVQRLYWTLHFFLMILLLIVIIKLDSMPLITYIVCATIAHSIISIRAFFEHRPAINPMHRNVIVKSNWFFQLLFLNNNFHAVHHRYPTLPWYRLSTLYNETKDEVLEKNQGFYFSGYSKWLTFLFRPVHGPIHPGSLDD